MNLLPDAKPHSDEAPRDALPHQQRRARRPQTTRALRRSREERVLGGVCGGIARFVDARPSTIRLVWGLSVIPSIGVSAVGYLLVWLMLPAEPEG